MCPKRVGRGTQWVAFPLDGETPIEALCLWNLGSYGDQHYRNLNTFDIYITDNDKMAIDNGGSLVLSDFTKITDTLTASTARISNTAILSTYFEVDIPTGTTWVVLSNFTNHSANGINSNVGIGKVAFLDSKLPCGFAAKAATQSSIYAAGRTATQLLTATPGDRFYVNNPFVTRKELRFSCSYDNQWNSDSGTNQWVAFDLGATYDLEGISVWNSSYSNGDRGAKDFELYVITQADVDALGFSFDDLTSKNWATISDAAFLDLDATDRVLDTVLERAQDGFAEEQYFGFDISDAAWVILHTTSNYGSGYGTALGQVRFDGTLSGSSDSAVPEPATWAMLLMGVVGGYFLRKPRRLSRGA